MFCPLGFFINFKHYYTTESKRKKKTKKNKKKNKQKKNNSVLLSAINFEFGRERRTACIATIEYPNHKFTNSESWCSWISVTVCVWGIVWLVCCYLVSGCDKHKWYASLVSGNSYLLSLIFHPSSIPLSPPSLPLSLPSPFPPPLLCLSLPQHTLQDLTVTVGQTFYKSIPLVSVLAAVFLSYSFTGHIFFGAVRTGEVINYRWVCVEWGNG